MDQLRSWLDLPEEAAAAGRSSGCWREGRGFRNYHVHQAPCGPSRSTFYTGQHIQKTGMYTNPVGEFGAYSVRRAGRGPVEGNYRGLSDDRVRCCASRATTPLTKASGTSASINQKVGKQRVFPNATSALESYGFSDYNYDGEHTGLTWAGFGHDGVGDGGLDQPARSALRPPDARKASRGSSR